MEIGELLIHWTYKPILQWSILDILIMTSEAIIVLFIIALINGIAKNIKLFKNNLTKPK